MIAGRQVPWPWVTLVLSVLLLLACWKGRHTCANSERLARMLVAIDDVFGRNGVEWYTDGGLMLGAVREGRILPWEFDNDIAINAKDYDKLLRLLMPGLSSWLDWLRPPHPSPPPLLPILQLEKRVSEDARCAAVWEGGLQPVQGRVRPVLFPVDAILGRGPVRPPLRPGLFCLWTATFIIIPLIMIFLLPLLLVVVMLGSSPQDRWLHTDIFCDEEVPAGEVEAVITRMGAIMPTPLLNEPYICYTLPGAPACRAKSHMFPLDERVLSDTGRAVKVPHDSNAVLTQFYGEDWRVPHTKGIKKIWCSNVFWVVLLLAFFGIGASINKLRAGKKPKP